METAISVALIGAGVFVKKSYIPTLELLKNKFHLKAIYSRSEKSAKEAIDILKEKEGVDSYHGDDLNKLLSRSDIQLVIIALPIDVMETTIRASLEAGKHVLSEKPLTSNVESGKKLIDEYTEKYLPKGIIWGVAENWHYEPNYKKAADLVKNDVLGNIRMVNATHYTWMSTDNPYYHTDWRKNPTHMGGFLFDFGVHLVSGLRLICGEVEYTTGITSVFREDLQPSDSVASMFKLKSGALGTMSISFAVTDVSAPLKEHAHPNFIIVGDKAIMHVYLNKVELYTKSNDKTEVKEIIVERREFLVDELNAYYDALLLNDAKGVYTPQEALEDVRFIENILKNNTNKN